MPIVQFATSAFLSDDFSYLTCTALKGIGGSPKTVKRLKSGDILIETLSATQTKSFLLAKKFLDHPVNVSVHRGLNSSRGVVSEKELVGSSDTEILEELSSQGVTAVRRINIKREGKLIPTKHIILTFNSTKLPSTIKAGFLSCPVKPYIPNPIRCFNCQRFGHSKIVCRGKLVPNVPLSVIQPTIVPQTPNAETALRLTLLIRNSAHNSKQKRIFRKSESEKIYLILRLKNSFQNKNL
ncbi:hypothetical protein AVEN_250962-1 [Araneus ventricosus]|uniref:CCHC-type domain-containing protein n=1 Tax=Araneus ventricosus TaxID=182803 RepID=A0A4Y2P187_ARAVE|nr:hypothetical protein AVEN_250962-1 [Araneus ventricosus]